MIPIPKKINNHGTKWYFYSNSNTSNILGSSSNHIFSMSLTLNSHKPNLSYKLNKSPYSVSYPPTISVCCIEKIKNRIQKKYNFNTNIYRKVQDPIIKIIGFQV